MPGLRTDRMGHRNSYNKIKKMKSNYKIFLWCALCCLLQGDLLAQTTIWVKKSAPTDKETYAASFSQDGTRVFSGSECSPSYLRIFNTSDGTVTWDYEVGGSLMCIQGVKLSTDGTHAAAIEEMGNLLIFDYSGATPTLLSTIPTGTSGAFALDFSPDGTRIVVGCTDKKAMIYRVSDGALLHSFVANGTWVMAVDWSADGKFIATAGNDNTVKIWDSTGVLQKTLTGHTGATQAVRFTADGVYVVSGSKDDKLKIWDVASGTLVRTLSGHAGDVMSVDVSDDGMIVASGSADTTIRLWSFSTGAQIAQFSKPGAGTVYAVDISPDKTKLVAGTSNGDVQLWSVAGLTGVPSSFEIPQLTVFPNPCHDWVQLPDGVSSIVLTDEAGRVVISNEGSLKRVDVSALVPGLYTIQLTGREGGVRFEKIMKR